MDRSGLGGAIEIAATQTKSAFADSEILGEFGEFDVEFVADF